MLTFQPTKVAMRNGYEDGLLVYVEDRLTAVLTRLRGPDHGEQYGFWHMEAGFGRLDGQRPQPFATLDDVQDWIGRKSIRK